MSNIRRQSIISSLVIYIGFAIGLLNTYFFTKDNYYFTEDQYGMATGAFIAIATMMMAFATLAMPSYVFKFFPYYNDNLPPKKNDLITWALLVSTIGFVIVVIAGIVFKHLIVRKFGEHAPQLLTYYNWIFPMGLGLTFYTVLEAYTWSLHKSVFTNYLREIQWRLYTTLLIALVITGVIKDFDLFIKLYAFGYPSIALTLFIYLLVTKQIHFTFKVSKVSRRFSKKILALCSYVSAGTLVFTLAKVFDTFVLASLKGLAAVGIFTLGDLITSIIQAPQRSIVSASMSHLSKGWKEKNMGLIQKVYQRSSINLLIFACGVFLLIWLNFSDGVNFFGLKKVYLEAASVFFLLGLAKIIDMGTGVNAQIIATSTYWRFELISGVILLCCVMPLSYFLAKSYGVIGPAIASVISLSIYNLIRIIFLWKKFKLFPFTPATLYTIVFAAVAYGICYFAFKDMHGLMGMIIRSTCFLILYGTGVIYFKLSPDIKPVWIAVRKRLGM